MDFLEPEMSSLDSLCLQIPVGPSALEGLLRLPGRARSLVLVALGSGKARFSGANQALSRHLAQAGYASLLLDLLTGEEDALDPAAVSSDPDLLAERILEALQWLLDEPPIQGMRAGLLAPGSSAPAALRAGSARNARFQAMVCCGKDFDESTLGVERIRAATLLILSDDGKRGRAGKMLKKRMHCPRKVATLGGVSDFGDPDIARMMAEMAVSWFGKHLL